MALSHSEELQQSENALRQAELDREIAKTAFLPGVEGSAMGAYALPDMDMMGMKLRMRGTYMAGINLTQPIYTGGKITTGHRLARIGEEAAAERLRMTRMDVLVEADNAYWTYIAVGRKVRMLESYHAQMDTLYLQTAAAFAAGMATENDLLRIEAKRSDIRYQLQKVQNGADLCRMSLCRIVGVDFDTRIEATDTALVVSPPTGFRRKRQPVPSCTCSKSRLQPKRSRSVWHVPTCSLPSGCRSATPTTAISSSTAWPMPGGGTMVPYSQKFQDGMGLVMLSVKIPIFHWGESRKKVRKAQYGLRNAELDLQKNGRLLDIEVQQAIRNVQDGYLLILTAEKGLQQAEENLRVTHNRYAASMAPLTDLLDAQSQWQQAESNLIEAQTQYKIYETEYLRATGELE